MLACVTRKENTNTMKSKTVDMTKWITEVNMET
jgi:hypothetical protein